MQTNNLLEQLKDIYLPEKVSFWWPLAYGWWLVISFAIFVIIILLFIRHLKKNKKKYIELVVDDFRKNIEETYNNKPQEVLQIISLYLKRVALQKFPNSNVKTLYGQDWLAFLDSKSRGKDFTSTKAKLLKDSYKPIILDRNSLEEIINVAQKWLRRVL